MASIHVHRQIDKAREKGGYAGHEDALPLWELSKRELVEIALRFGALLGDEDTAEEGVRRSLDEHHNLKANGII